MTSDQIPWVAGILLVVVFATIVFWVWWKGRPADAGPGGEVFRASRLSRGNHLFPTQVCITPTSVVHHTPQWIGKVEHSIHIAHVSSVRIDTNLLFSDVYIETSGGAAPVSCHGHSKKDAVRMKRLVELHQSAYYRAPRPQAG